MGINADEKKHFSNLKVMVVGTDERQIYLAQRLAQSGVQLVNEQLANTADVAIFPIPVSKEEYVFRRLVFSGFKGIIFGGLFTEDHKIIADERVDIFDYAKDDQFAQLNAIPSAEGSIRLIVSNLKKTLHDSRVLILGYGRIAKHLHRLLCAFGGDVIVCARSEDARKQAALLGATVCDFSELVIYIKNVDVVVNTVPQQVLTKKELSLAKKEVYLQDLASKPGGIPQTEAKECGLSVDWALALPSRFTPQTAAWCVATVVDNVLGGVICKIKP